MSNNERATSGFGVGWPDVEDALLVNLVARVAVFCEDSFRTPRESGILSSSSANIPGTTT